MEIAFDEMAEQDIQYWKKSGNMAIQKKIQKLLTAIKEEPYNEHRIIYSVQKDIIHIHSLKGHYD